MSLCLSFVVCNDTRTYRDTAASHPFKVAARCHYPTLSLCLLTRHMTHATYVLPTFSASYTAHNACSFIYYCAYVLFALYYGLAWQHHLASYVRTMARRPVSLSAQRLVSSPRSPHPATCTSLLSRTYQRLASHVCCLAPHHASQTYLTSLRTT